MVLSTTTQHSRQRNMKWSTGALDCGPPQGATTGGHHRGPQGSPGFSDFDVFGLPKSFWVDLHRSRSILDHSGAILNLEFSGVFEARIPGGILKLFGQAVHAWGHQTGAQGPGPRPGPGPLGPSLWSQSRSHPMATGRRKLGAPVALWAPVAVAVALAVAVSVAAKYISDCYLLRGAMCKRFCALCLN